MQTIAHFEQNKGKIDEKIQQTQVQIQTTRIQQHNIQQEVAAANIPDPRTLKDQITQHTQQQAIIQSSIVLDTYRSINTTLILDIADQPQAIMYAHQVIQAAIQQ